MKKKPKRNLPALLAAAGVGSSRVKSELNNLADLAAGVAVNQVRVATLTCFGVYNQLHKLRPKGTKNKNSFVSSILCINNPQ